MSGRHTLKEFDTTYKPLTVQLVFADHLISIDTRVNGSAALYRAFKDFKFDLYRFDRECKHLVLKY